MSLVDIAPPAFDVLLEIAYGSAANFTGVPVYKRPAALLHPVAAEKLQKACALAAPLGLRIKVFDAFRPTEAQWVLWNHTPDPDFLADPAKGSPHSRGVALDLTLVEENGEALEMGTPFDAFTPLSHHACLDVPLAAQKNRLLLLGLMSAAGWDFYSKEWWHYQLFDSRTYPLISDTELDHAMM